MFSTVLTVLQMISAALLIGVILLQAQGSGLSASFGGTGESFRSRRSIEKFLLYATVVLATSFALFSILLLVYR